VNKVSVILLTWKRLYDFERMLIGLANQTYKDFNVYVSNSNEEQHFLVERLVAKFNNHLNIEASLDSNDFFAFRRFYVAKKLAETGSDIILFIDDDVVISDTYIEEAISQYEPKTYKSAYAWKFDDGVQEYMTDRTRMFSVNDKIHYCGTSTAMVDASVFLDPQFFEVDPMAYMVDDLWLSYYADHVLGWKLQYMHINKLHIGGNDYVALFKTFLNGEAGYTKTDFLKYLINLGWDLSPRQESNLRPRD
jgi:hypothetical protein